MTISTTNSRVEYTGAGTTGPFSFPYYFLEDDDLVVIKRTIATGAQQTLTLTTDYTVGGAGVPAGGSVTTVAAVSSAYEIVIFRDPDILQGTEYPEGDRFPSASHEKALDKLTMVAQRLKDLITRSLRLTDGDTTGGTMELPADRAGKYLAFDAGGNAVATAGTSSDVVVSAFAETLLDDPDASTMRATIGAEEADSSILKATDIGVSIQAHDADTLKSDTTKALTAGYSATPFNAGTKSTGSFAPDESNGNFQYYINGGAHVLAPPTNNCTLIIQITNNASAGVITTSGFTKVTGTAPGTTSGDDFLAYITKINGFSHLAWQAMQ